MPTGYTAGILNGKIKTFPEFAKLCIKAFGACIHMREDSMTAKYKPRTVDKYYLTAVREAEIELTNVQTLSDEEIISNHKKYLISQEESYIKGLQEIKIKREKLNKFLEKAKTYTPPTKEHVGVKIFMIQQLEETIKFDADSSYYIEQLSSITKRMENTDAIELREQILQSALDSVKNAKRHLKEEQDRVASSNEWVKTFIKSLK